MVDVWRLCQKIEGAITYRIDRVLDCPMAREHNNRESRIARPATSLSSSPPERPGILRSVITRSTIPLSMALRPSARQPRSEPHSRVESECFGQPFADVLLIINNKNGKRYGFNFPYLSSCQDMSLRSFWGTGRVMVKVVPSPTFETTEMSPEVLHNLEGDGKAKACAVVSFVVK